MYNINLLPPEMRKNRTKKIKIQRPTYSIILLILVLIISGSTKLLIDIKIKENTTIQNELYQEYIELNENLNRNNSKAIKNQKENTLINLLNQIESIKGKQYLWFNVLNKISEATPATVTIEKIEEIENNDIMDNKTTSIKIYGLTYSFKDLKIIEQSYQSVFDNVKLLEYENNTSTILERAKFDLGKQQDIEVGASEKIGNKISFSFILTDNENQPVFSNQVVDNNK